MLPAQLCRLLSCQTHRMMVKQQHHVPSLLPAVLRSCIFHLCRIQSSSVAAAPVSPSQPLALCRGVSTSAPLYMAVKKPMNKKVASPASARNESCQVFDSSELLVGHMTVQEAEEVARKDGLKLVDLGINADGLRSFQLVSGRELAEESKRQRLEKKGEKLKEKEFRVTSNITDHDLDIKLRQARDILSRGVLVKFVIKAHRRTEQDVGEKRIAQLLKKVTTELEDQAVVKQGTRTAREQQLLLRPLTSVAQSGDDQ